MMPLLNIFIDIKCWSLYAGLAEGEWTQNPLYPFYEYFTAHRVLHSKKNKL
jgi:hypothetical protein